MTMEINCEARFEAAHRLSFYDGKCARLHGHNWLVKLKIKSFMEERDILFDFTHLKKMVDIFDHMVLLKNNTLNKPIIESLPIDWVCRLPFEPTAENLATYFVGRITEMDPELKGEVRIEVWENEKSYAVAEGRLHGNTSF